MAHQLTLKKRDRKAIEDFQFHVKKLLGDGLIQLALFGSKLTGRDTPESDIDILVLVKDVALSAKTQILDAAFDVNLKYDVYISPRVMTLAIYNDPVWSETPFLKSLKSAGLTL